MWEDYMNKLCISPREHAADKINFEKKKMLPLPEKELKSHHDATHLQPNVTFVEKNWHKNMLKIKITKKLETNVIL